MPVNIIEALADVRRIKRHVLESQQFYGYSGLARIIGGILSLLTAVILASSSVPLHPAAHLTGWGTLCMVAGVVNYGALALWYSRLDRNALDRTRFKPIIDPIPSLVGGAIVSIACIVAQHYDLLFGVWMVFFGVAHLAARASLDDEVSYLGWFYIIAGALQLLLLQGSFLNPWPMGIVFFVGEITGGLIFVRMRRRIGDE